MLIQGLVFSHQSIHVPNPMTGTNLAPVCSAILTKPLRLAMTCIANIPNQKVDDDRQPEPAPGCRTICAMANAKPTQADTRLTSRPGIA